jgi:hypothetical protein
MLWDFYKDGLTQSFINKFLECRKQCYLEYVEGWTKTTESMWFNYGHHVHHVLSHVYQDYKVPTFTEIERLLFEYRAKRFDLDKISPEQLRENQLIYEAAAQALKIYFTYYSTEFKNNWLHTEKIFKVPFQDTFLTGKFDGVYENENGELWLMDHKCLSVFDEDTLILALPYDLQVNIYLYAANELFQKFPSGLMYNIIKRPGIRLRKDENGKQFAQRVMLDILSKPEDYFIRIPLRRDPIELKEWIYYQLSKYVEQIRDWYTSGYANTPVSPGNLTTKYGRSNTFGLITNGSTYGLYQRKVAHPELDV